VDILRSRQIMDRKDSSWAWQGVNVGRIARDTG